ncbi:hypothetical protein WEH80_35275 [Actinomycetes bacterium KLBMP 9759]
MPLRPRRALAALLVSLALVPLGTGTAAAHGGDGPEPSPHLPRILAVEPAVPGLAVTVVEGGYRLRIDNATGSAVTVLPPDGAVRGAEPVVAPGGSARWADLRVAAAEAGGPPTEGGRAWTVPLLVGDTPVLVRGEQIWPAPPSAALWWALTALAAAGAAVIGIAAVGRRRLAVPLAATTLLVATAHLVHVLGSALIVDGMPYVQAVVGSAGVSIIVWPIAGVGAVLAARARRYGPLLCALAGAVLAQFSAFELAAFGNAVLPFGWSPDLDRAMIVVTFGGGLGLFVSGLRVLSTFTATPS